MEEANRLIGAGKKHLAMGEAVEAAAALQEACGMLAKRYGDTADECGEAFFWCGKALLDLARMENSVLGNALEGVPEEEEEEEEEKNEDANVEEAENVDEKTREELRVQVYDAMAAKKEEEKKNEDSVKAEGKNGDGGEAEAGDEQQNAMREGDEEEEEDGKPGSKEKTENNEKAEKKPVEEEEEEEEEEAGGDGEDEEDDDAGMEVNPEEQGGGDAAAEKEEQQQEEQQQEEQQQEEEEVGNLQLAWEMLEVAKVIYGRKDGKEEQLMAAQAHLKLGEVSAESGNYAQALEDFRECLKLQVKHLEPDSRLLAETHYQLGLTYSLDLQHSLAVEELRSSVSVIQSRLEKLQKLLDEADGPEALPEEKKEMEELKALLPEIQEKVEDATESQKLAAAEGVKGEPEGGASSAGVTGPAGEDGTSSPKMNQTPANGMASTNGHAPLASDISHLVRKKRKPEESPVKESLVKKMKSDAGQTNGDTNGHD